MVFTRAVEEFWRRSDVCDSQRARMALLRTFAALVVDEGRKRAEAGAKNRSRYMRKLGPLAGACWCCGRARATTRHHIVALKNGGRTKPANIAALCQSCHDRVHEETPNGE